MIFTHTASLAYSPRPVCSSLSVTDIKQSSCLSLNWSQINRKEWESDSEIKHWLKLFIGDATWTYSVL